MKTRKRLAGPRMRQMTHTRTGVARMSKSLTSGRRIPLEGPLPVGPGADWAGYGSKVNRWPDLCLFLTGCAWVVLAVWGYVA